MRTEELFAVCCYQFYAHKAVFLLTRHLNKALKKGLIYTNISLLPKNLSRLLPGWALNFVFACFDPAGKQVFSLSKLFISSNDLKLEKKARCQKPVGSRGMWETRPWGPCPVHSPGQDGTSTYWPWWHVQQQYAMSLFLHTTSAIIKVSRQIIFHMH